MAWSDMVWPGSSFGLQSVDHDKCKKQFIAHLTQFSFFMGSHRPRPRLRPRLKSRRRRQREEGDSLAGGHACKADKVSLTRTLHTTYCLECECGMQHAASWTPAHGPWTVHLIIFIIIVEPTVSNTLS